MVTPKVQEKLHESEARVKVLTEEWAHRWDETASLLQEEGGSLALRREGGMGVVLDSELPHLIGIDDNLLSTGIMLYHLKQGTTSIGTAQATTQQDIGQYDTKNVNHYVRKDIFRFKYDLEQKYYAPQVGPEWGLNSLPPDYDSIFHGTETPALTTWPSVIHTEKV